MVEFVTIYYPPVHFVIGLKIVLVLCHIFVVFRLLGDRGISIL